MRCPHPSSPLLTPPQTIHAIQPPSGRVYPCVFAEVSGSPNSDFLCSSSLRGSFASDHLLLHLHAPSGRFAAVAPSNRTRACKSPHGLIEIQTRRGRETLNETRVCLRCTFLVSFPVSSPPPPYGTLLASSSPAYVQLGLKGKAEQFCL